MVRLDETILRAGMRSVQRTETILGPDPAQKLTFWSIPPFRARLREAAATITVRQVRYPVAIKYAVFYLHYGLRLPVVLLLSWSSAVGTGPAATDLAFATIPYLLVAGIVCELACAVAGGGAAWYAVTLAINSREPNRLRWAIWGALGAGGPALLMMAAVPAERTPAQWASPFLPLLFGAGIGAGVHWVVQRDRRRQAAGLVEPVVTGTSVVTHPDPLPEGEGTCRSRRDAL